MNHFSSAKPVFISSVVAVSLAAALLTARAQNPRKLSRRKPLPKPLRSNSRNVQVLKDIPADQLIPGMQFITASPRRGMRILPRRTRQRKRRQKTKVTARKMME